MNHTFSFLLKRIGILSAIFSMVIFISGDIINAKTIPSEEAETLERALQTDTKKYQNIDTPILSNVGVAIATNIGTEYFKKTNTDGSSSGINEVYDEILDIDEMIQNPDTVRVAMIQRNMLIIREYLAYLKTDLRAQLDASENREATLDSFIKQLEFRYKNAVNSQQTLLAQRNYLAGIVTDSDAAIETIKQRLDIDFKAYNDRATIADVQDYLEQKNINTVASTYLVFTSKFLEQYDFLNNYNKELLDTLILNKKAIATESYVVIPDSGDSLLDDFNLLYDEDEFKAQR